MISKTGRKFFLNGFSPKKNLRHKAMTIAPEVIFLHFINRELYEALGRKPDLSKIHTWIELLCLSQTLPLSCNIAQIYEFLGEAISILNLCAELVDAGKLETLSQTSTTIEFKETRRELYHFDRERYPVYFENLWSEADAVRIGKIKKQETTKYLAREIIGWDEQELFTKGNLILSSSDKLVIAPKIDLIRKVTLDRGNNAITASLYRQRLSENDLTHREAMVLPRLMSGLYITHYESVLHAKIPSGASDIELNDVENGFPDADLFLLYHVFLNLGLYSQSFRSSESYHKQIANACLTINHIRLSRTLRNCLLVLDSMIDHNVGRSTRRVKIIEALAPQLSRNRIEYETSSLNDFLARAAASMERIVSALAASSKEFSAIYQLKGESLMARSILIHTATDAEDDAFVNVFCISGNNNVKTLSIEGSFVREFSLPNDVTIYHVRTSMGMIGPTAAGYALQPIIKKLDPNHIISAGICFGLKKRNSKNW
jgi:hypothetical protein